ncbi:MAG: DUF1491 family protein [Sphingomonadaceae bacterium]|nr:DUF1491 family protein [Sphingomonadaceae bacterium]
MSGKLNAGLWVGAIVRLAQSRGDFATIAKKGDETAGQVILVARRRNGHVQVYSRTMNSRGDYSWTIAIEAPAEELGKVNDYLGRQRRYDPDLWIVDLDTDNPERFVVDELI